MNKKVVFRQLGRNDIPLITDLFNSLFTVKKPEAFFLWESFEYISPVFIMGAFCGDELIGTFGIQKRTLESGLMCGQAHWPAVNPMWQGKSIFSELTRIVMDQFTDLDLVFNFFPARARVPVEKSLGMKMFDTPEMILSLLDKFENPGVAVSRASANTTFRRFERRRQSIFMFKNTSEYRHWRYARHPFYSYEIIKIDTGEYAVVKNFVNPVTKDTYGDIVDIECDQSDCEKIRKLILGACWRLKAQGMANITLWAMPNTELREVVEKIGFRESGRGKYYFGLKVPKSQHNYLYDFSKWRLQQCDSQKY